MKQCLSDAGVIFDMDGVISDTQGIHARIESEILEGYGIILTPDEITQRFAGVRTRDFLESLLTEAGVDVDMDYVMRRKWDEMNKAVLSSGVHEIDGVRDLLICLAWEKCMMSVGSASPFAFVGTVISTLDLLDFFTVMVGGDQVVKGKPDPETFLICAQAMRFDPDECFVIEDGLSGMIAAKEAGMKCIALATHVSHEKCDEVGVDLVVDSFTGENQVRIIEFILQTGM